MSLAMALTPTPTRTPTPTAFCVAQIDKLHGKWQTTRCMPHPTPRCLSIFICPMQTVCDFYPLPPLHRSPLSADHKLHFIIRLIVHPCVEPMSSDCTTAGHSGRLAVRHEKERGRRREGSNKRPIRVPNKSRLGLQQAFSCLTFSYLLSVFVFLPLLLRVVLAYAVRVCVCV